MKRGGDGSIANDVTEKDLNKLEKRLEEQGKQKKWTGRINFKTKPPTPIFTWPPLKMDDLLRDPAVVIQHEKDKKIQVLENKISELTYELKRVDQSISELSTREGSDDQIMNLEELKNKLKKELVQKEEELSEMMEI
jgi:hypothetical protein